jgi:hypothetical protein
MIDLNQTTAPHRGRELNGWRISSFEFYQMVASSHHPTSIITVIPRESQTQKSNDANVAQEGERLHRFNCDRPVFKVTATNL